MTWEIRAGLAVALCAVVRRAGIEAVRRHRPGSQDGFTALRRLTGIGDPSTDETTGS